MEMVILGANNSHQKAQRDLRDSQLAEHFLLVLDVFVERLQLLDVPQLVVVVIWLSTIASQDLLYFAARLFMRFG